MDFPQRRVQLRPQLDKLGGGGPRAVLNACQSPTGDRGTTPPSLPSCDWLGGDQPASVHNNPE